ncbi:MAG: AAA family ATPase [Luteolibacter sp.]|uniref:AAA family ATPase n=1 Tax=Luteolibacter sp. TaxID=1962973 RepID=UPI003265BA47
MQIEPTEALVQKLAGARGSFKTFIDYIRFPYFKNLEENTVINFDFPITALVGSNGSGKSSVLQALFGAPQGYSTGLFWFSTSMDPIEEGSGKRNCFIYGYKNQKRETVEVLKTRIQWNKKEGNSKNPDYWEPSRPLKKYGMTMLAGQRHPAIEMEVHQIDFRFQISAFDRFFYLEEVQPWHRAKRRSKQDILRERSAFVKRSFSGEKIYSEKSAEKVEILSDEELEVVCAILGKNYVEGKVLRHKFYKEWGNSVLFKSDSLSYSEANAGSGEVAVVLMVQRLMRAKTSSLVLLDEPEYSLHPGAQKNLLRFLLKRSLTNKLQIIFTTHSPAMIEGLPSSAIKVFENNLQGQFKVFQNRNVDEAFVSIGHTITDKVIVRVEDYLAKASIELSLEAEIPEFSNLVDIQFYPGGTGKMKEDISNYSLENFKKHIVLFDGDERRDEAIDPQTVAPADRNESFYDQKIKICAGQTIKFSTDGGESGGRVDQLVELQEKYLDFWRQRVLFFPFDKLEAEFWDEDFCKKQLDDILPEADVSKKMIELNAASPKERFAILARCLFNQSRAKDIQNLQTLFVKHWIKRRPEGHEKLVATLHEIRDLPR